MTDSEVTRIPPEAKRVFEGVIFDVYHWPQEMYDGSMATFEMLKRADTVSVLAVTDSGKVLLLNQTQPNRQAHLTIPAGRVDSGENPLVAAKRELLEETGYSFRDWSLKSIDQAYPKIVWYGYFYVATGQVGKQDQQLDNGEKIEVLEVDYSEIVGLIKKGHLSWCKPLIQQILNGREQLSDILDLLEITD